MSYEDGEPCSHAGCLSHVTQPCGGCGRLAGINWPELVEPEGPLLELARKGGGPEHDWTEEDLVRMIDAVYLTKPLSLTEILFGDAKPTGRGSVRLGDMVPDLPEDIADLDAVVDVEKDILHFPGMTHEQWKRFRALACEESEGA